MSWLDDFFGKLGILSAGSPLPVRGNLDFSSDFELTDDPANDKTIVALSQTSDGFTAIAPFTTGDSTPLDILVYTFPAGVFRIAEVEAHLRWLDPEGSGSGGGWLLDGSATIAIGNTTAVIGAATVPPSGPLTLHVSGRNLYIRVTGDECYTANWSGEYRVRVTPAA